MLTEEHFDMLTRFRVRAMGDKLREMVEDDSYDSYAFEERMEMLIEAEATARRGRKVAKLVREARFKPPSACVGDVAYLKDRKLSRDRVARLPHATGSRPARPSRSYPRPAAARASSGRRSATPRAAGSSPCATPALRTSWRT